MNTGNLAYPEPVADIASSYWGNAFPVIAATSSEKFFAYRKNTSGGIYYRRYYSDGMWHYGSETLVPGTSFTSLYPAICIDDQGTYYNPLHLVYQFGNLTTSILYNRFNAGSFGADFTVSSSTAYNTNTKPSISLYKKDAGQGTYRYEPIVSWIGSSGGNSRKK